MFKKIGVFLLDIVEVVVFAIGIFFFVYLLIMRPHKIKGQSMHPNFPNGEYLLTERVTYYLRDPKRGDVVVFTPPISETDEFIKRIVGLPGENVMFLNGQVYINETVVNESYIDDSIRTSNSSFLAEGVEFKVPDGEYFVLGDNRPHSSDSRAWGPIKKKSISGRAWVVYWPLTSTGTVKTPTY